MHRRSHAAPRHCAWPPPTPPPPSDGRPPSGAVHVVYSTGKATMAEALAAELGLVHVDGCAYGGPPSRPFTLRIEAGSVANVADLDAGDEQQRWARGDLSRDPGAAVLCELGLGTNPGALWHADLMEAEQARGTCHLGFGEIIAYGGRNASATHVDFVLSAPTITVDGLWICQDGAYRL